MAHELVLPAGGSFVVKKRFRGARYVELRVNGKHVAGMKAYPWERDGIDSAVSAAQRWLCISNGGGVRGPNGETLRKAL